jgi:hypothetical protein
VIRCDGSSASILIFYINNNSLIASECLREAGAGGSNPLTPTSNPLDVGLALIRTTAGVDSNNYLDRDRIGEERNRTRSALVAYRPIRDGGLFGFG